MANAVYPLYKQSLLAGDANSNINTNTATDGPFCSLQAAGYTYSAAHQFASSLAATVGTDQRITTPAIATGGIFSGDNLTYTAVTGSQVVALAIYRHNAGANTTWRLVVFFDTVTGLPVTPNGGNITITWNVSGIFQT